MLKILIFPVSGLLLLALTQRALTARVFKFVRISRQIITLLLRFDKKNLTNIAKSKLQFKWKNNYKLSLKSNNFMKVYVIYNCKSEKSFIIVFIASKIMNLFKLYPLLCHTSINSVYRWQLHIWELARLFWRIFGNKESQPKKYLRILSLIS